MTAKEYQKAELDRFTAEHAKGRAFFDNVPDFIERWGEATTDELRTQLDWIENGSYGTDACFALQRVMESLNSRTNGVARVGRFFLTCLYGEDFRHWHKLPVAMHDALTKAVENWLAKEPKEYAQTLEA